MSDTFNENGGVVEDDGYLFPYVDTKATARQRARRQQQADQLIAKSQQGGGMVGPIFVGKNPLGTMIEAGAGTYINSQVAQEEKDEAQQLADIRQQLLKRMSANATPEQRQAIELSAASANAPELRGVIDAAAKNAWSTPGSGYTLGPDQQRYDASGKVIASGPTKSTAEKNPVSVQEYNFAKGEGFKGSFMDFMKAKTAATTRIRIDAPQADAGPFAGPATQVGIDPRTEQPVFRHTKTGQLFSLGEGGATPHAGMVGPKPAATTEAERGAAGYLGRMQASNAELDRIGKSGYPTPLTAGVGALPRVGGIAQRVASTPEQQRFYQQASDWVRAKLRKESGAVIGEKEMADEIATYFPQVGDSPELIAQKSQSRRQAEEQMKSSAGRVKPVIAPSAAPSGGRTVVSSKAEFDALQSCAKWETPDGRRGTK